MEQALLLLIGWLAAGFLVALVVGKVIRESNKLGDAPSKSSNRPRSPYETEVKTASPASAERNEKHTDL